jgi:hypothetical protein
VKEGAFLPNPSDGITSTYRIDSLTDSQVWELAVLRLEQVTPGPAVKAAAVIAAGDVAEVGLALVPDDNPPRHVGIGNWPEDKGAAKSKAQLLAEAASLRHRAGS